MAIKVARNREENRIVSFPSKPLLYVDDKISLAASDLEDNSQGGLGEAVFFSFRGLHEILSGAKTYLSFEDEASKSQNWRLNSRVISASLGRGRHIELQKDVKINLRHLADPEMGLRDPVCVFWDYEVHAWSDSGCRLIESNATESVCQCDHLTNFALLMRPPSSGSFTNLRMDIVAICVGCGVFLLFLGFVFKVSLFCF